jgi:regulator of replication initiation timing
MSSENLEVIETANKSAENARRAFLAETQLNGMRDKLVETHKEHTSLRSKISAVESQNTRLQAENNSLGQWRNERDKTMAENRDLTSQINLLKAQLSQAEAKTVEIDPMVADKVEAAQQLATALAVFASRFVGAR